MRYISFILLSLALATSAFAFSGKVVGVSDGDTITVLTEKKEQVKVRLYGIDCPESSQAFGTRAKQFTSGLVFGKQVDVDSVGKDRYGRTVGTVRTQDGIDVNQALVESGMAWVYDAYCRAPQCPGLKAKEASARASKAGLWADTDPTPPWAFRKAGKGSGPNTQATAAAQGPEYHGNTHSMVFHVPGCRHYNCKHCTRVLKTRDAAIEAGFKPCNICRP